ncbi:hypothetical protein EGW08_011966 [Elysia chlorotica]|uniref:Kazal-like domain-containing protein n=1 Tax=Elysia chlorotica TaxID=188477 RepID=A0A3S0ZL46_ELYCH|nr:hypothetical protein EGW08_011966 [Elysia chlorotica]
MKLFFRRCITLIPRIMHLQVPPSPGKRWPGAGPTSRSMLCLLLAVCVAQTWGLSPLMLADDSQSYSAQCGACDESRCPVLSYCEGRAIKDSCNCCTVCSSPKYQPHVSLGGGELGLAQPPLSAEHTPKHECGKVECPRFQVCVANMQGLPLCKCPSEFLCRSNRKRAICGTDGITYESKCHMRIASCKQGMMVRKKHRGVCTEDDERDGETYKRKMRRRLRRRRRRRQKLEEEAVSAGGIGADTEGESEIGEEEERNNEDALTGFSRGSDVFGNEDRRGRLEQVEDDADSPGGKRDERKDRKAKLQRRRRKKKNRKQRKQKKGGKRGNSERRRRRRKRQHGKVRSRSKRHRHAKGLDDAESRARLFEEEFGQSTWFA